MSRNRARLFGIKRLGDEPQERSPGEVETVPEPEAQQNRRHWRDWLRERNEHDAVDFEPEGA